MTPHQNPETGAGELVAVPRRVFQDFLDNQPGWPDTARRYLNAPSLQGGEAGAVAWRWRREFEDITWSEWNLAFSEPGDDIDGLGGVIVIEPLYAHPKAPELDRAQVLQLLLERIYLQRLDDEVRVVGYEDAADQILALASKQGGAG